MDDIQRAKVYCESDIVTLLSKSTKQKVIPGNAYVYNIPDLNTKVVFQKGLWKFCGKEIFVVESEDKNYNYVSTIAEPGIILLWRKEWFEFEKALDHSKCCWSSGIHDGLTVGQGGCNEYGYWEIPCEICARRHEKRFPNEAPVWPFKR